MVDTKVQPRKPVRSKSSDDGFTDKYFGGKDLSKPHHPADDEGMMSDASSSRRRRRASVAGSKPVKQKTAIEKAEAKGRRRASVASYLPKDDEGMMSDASSASTRSRRSGRRPSLRMTTDVVALTTTGSLMKKDPFEQDSETEDSILLPNPHDTPQTRNPTRAATARSGDDEASYMSDASSRSGRRGRRMSLRLTAESAAAAPDQSLMKGSKEDAASDVEEDLFAAVTELPNHQHQRITKTPKTRRGTVNAESPTKRRNHKSPRKGVSRTRSASPSADGSHRCGGHDEQVVTRTRSMSPSTMAGKRRGGKKPLSTTKSPKKSPRKRYTTTSSNKALEGTAGLPFNTADDKKKKKKKANREVMSDDSSSDESDNKSIQGWDKWRAEATERSFGKQRSDDVEDDDDDEEQLEEREKPRRSQHRKKNHSKHSNEKQNRNKDKKHHHDHPRQMHQQHHHKHSNHSHRHHDEDDHSHENDDDNEQSHDKAPQFEIPMQLEISTLAETASPVSPMDGVERGAREKKLCADDFKNMPSATPLDKLSHADKEKQKLQDQLKVASAAVTAWESDREQNSPSKQRHGSVRGFTRSLSNIFKKKSKDGGDAESDNESVGSAHSRRMRRAERFMHHRLLDDDSISDHSGNMF